MTNGEVIKERKPNIFSKIKTMLQEYKRTISISRKPDREEFISSMKITGSGMIFIGMMGFIIFLLYYLVVK